MKEIDTKITQSIIKDIEDFSSSCIGKLTSTYEIRIPGSNPFHNLMISVEK